MQCQEHICASNTLNRLHEWSGNDHLLEISGKSSSQEKKKTPQKALRKDREITRNIHQEDFSGAVFILKGIRSLRGGIPMVQ